MQLCKVGNTERKRQFVFSLMISTISFGKRYKVIYLVFNTLYRVLYAMYTVRKAYWKYIKFLSFM